VQELLAELEASLVNSLFEGGSETVTVSVDGIEIVAKLVSPEEIAAGGTIGVASGEATVNFPVSMFDFLDEPTVIVLSTFNVSDPSLGFPTTSGEEGDVVQYALSLNLAVQSSTEYVTVSGLDDPVVIVLGPATSQDLICAFYDEGLEEWSTDGITAMINETTGQLQCLSTHLTIFGSIARGIASTLQCSHADLLTREGVVALGEGKWYQNLEAVMFWILLICLFQLIIFAGYWDIKEANNPDAGIAWRNEDFLIADDSFAALADSQGDGVCSPLKALCGRGEDGNEVYGSDDEEAGAVASDDGEQEEGGNDQPRSVRHGFFSQLAAMLAAQALLRVTASKEWLTYDAAKFLHGARRTQLQGNKAAAGSGDPARAWSTVSSVRRTFIQDESSAVPTRAMSSIAKAQYSESAGMILHLSQKIRDGLHEPEERGICSLFWLLFRTHHRWISVAKYSFFMTHLTKAVVLADYTLGALMTGALFFQSAGAQSKDSDSDCDIEGIWEQIGRLIVVGSFSLLVASVPMLILIKLHARKFVYIGDSALKGAKQLLWWRVKDAVLCLLAVLYLLVCILFVAVFLANIAKKDAGRWAVAATVAMIQQMVLVPSLITLVHCTVIAWAAHYSQNWDLVQRRLGVDNIDLLAEPEDLDLNGADMQRPRSQDHQAGMFDALLPAPSAATSSREVPAANIVPPPPANIGMMP